MSESLDVTSSEEWKPVPPVRSRSGAAARVAGAALLGTVANLAVSSTSRATILRPDHVVILMEEDRFCNALGDIANLPYFNQLAASSLLYGNMVGLNTSAQQGEMNYLGLYSGSTQGITDNGRNYSFGGANIAKSLNSTPGMSFVGYAESLPSDGSQVQQASDPVSDPANHPDLYVRNYNPMAMFTDVGPGKTNADVNKRFAEFPTDFSTLPTVSLVVPNTLHNTHGSNESPPFATDPAAYQQLRQAADAWLLQNIDPYVQWAKTHNSLLIITTDELDRQHAGPGLTTLVTGAPGLFVPGTNLTAYNHYNTLRTVEDMYGLAPLGNSATAPAFTTNAAGQLVPVGAAKHWDGTTNAYSSTHWLNAGNAGPFFTSIGDTLAIGAGTARFNATTTGQFLTISNASASGVEVDVTGGTLSLARSGPAGAGYGLLLEQAGVLKVTTGAVSVAGPISIGQSAGSTATATLSGGTIAAGTAAGTDGTFYVGNAGTGTVTQSGTATVTAPMVALAATAGSAGTYNLTGGSLTTTLLKINPGGAFSRTGGSLSATTITQTGGSFSFTPTMTLATTGGNATTFDLQGGTLTAGAMSIGAGGVMNASGGGSWVATSVTQTAGTLAATSSIAIGSTAVSTYNLQGGSFMASAMSLGAGGTFTWSGGSLQVTSFTQTGGNFNATPAMTILGTGGGSYAIHGGMFSGGAVNVNADGAVSVDGTAAVTASSLSVGGSGTGTFSQGAGSVSATALGLGSVVGASGTYTLSGGNLTSSTTIVGDAGAGTFTQNAGTNTVTTSLTLGKQAGSSGTYNLAGGTLTVPVVNGTAGSSAFNFNGGTLRVTTASAAFFLGVGTATVQAGGATIDTNGNNVTLAVPLADGGGGGGLTKVGAGTLTLAGVNGFTGAAAVTAGMLTIPASASLASTSVTVAAGATLNVVGTLAPNTTVNANGGLSFGGNTTGGGAAMTRAFGTLALGGNVSAVVAPSTFAGAPLVLNPTSLAFAAGSKLDLANNALLTMGTIASIQTALLGGQIFSSATGGQLGYADEDGGQVGVRFTLPGDTNLDGDVDIQDLGNLATSYGTVSGAVWQQGDIDGDGAVDVTDLGDLAINYGGALAGGSFSFTSASEAAQPAAIASSSVVPEPSALMMLLAAKGALSMTRHRRRRVI